MKYFFLRENTEDFLCDACKFNFTLNFVKAQCSIISIRLPLGSTTLCWLCAVEAFLWTLLLLYLLFLPLELIIHLFCRLLQLLVYFLLQKSKKHHAHCLELFLRHMK